MDLITILGVQMTYLALTVLIGEALVGIVIAGAVIMAHMHRGRNHHWMILAAFLGDLLVMKPLMIYRVSQGAFGPFPYSHTPALPHMVLAIFAAALGITNIWLGFRYRVKSGKSKNIYLNAKGARHRLVGAVFVALWAATMIYGIWIFYTTYIGPL
jgi:uncharacterized membrane protein YozB (DUF420 family)